MPRLALGTAEGLHFALERFPVEAVLVLFGANFGVQSGPQIRQITGKCEGDDNTPGFQGREYLSGEWGAAVGYQSNGGATMRRAIPIRPIERVFRKSTRRLRAPAQQQAAGDQPEQGERRGDLGDGGHTSIL